MIVTATIHGIVACVACFVAQQEPAKQPAEDFENRIFIGQPDGSAMKLLVQMRDYRPQGSPTWSSDGKMIAFDAWREAFGETNKDSQIVVVHADGSKPQVFGDGAIPSFSPRHKRIVFSRYAPNYGVWVMSAEGPDKELVQLDPDGWGAMWSPDGKQIVYSVPEAAGANLVLFNLVEGQRTPLFEEGKSPYQSFFWYFSWSPDGRRIAFKGQRKGREKLEIGIVDARGASHGIVTRFEGQDIYNVAWSHDSKRIYFMQPVAKLGNRNQILWMDADSRDDPQLLAGQDPARGNSAIAFSPDGKQLLMVSRQPPPEKNKAPQAK
jgi:Tol biopolymer transport system component